jgi:hypothetical protein
MSSPINDININMNTEDEIKEIFEQNKVSDLKRFIKRRQCLNGCNIFMSYKIGNEQAVSRKYVHRQHRDQQRG